MTFEQETMLIIVGVVIGLMSSLITIIVQNVIDQRNKERQEKNTKQLLAYEAKITSDIEGSLFEQESHLKTVAETLLKIDEELSSRDISSVSTEKLVEFYLSYAQHIFRYEDWVKGSIRSEAEKVNALGIDKYKELRYSKNP